MAEAHLLESIAKQGQDELSGSLRLGAIYTVAPYLLPALVPALKETAPNMPLVIEENYTSALSAQLSRNELDVIVVAEPYSQAGVCSWPLYEENFVVAVPPQHAWAKKSSISPKALSQENLLLLGPGHCFRDQVIDSCPDCARMSDEADQPFSGSSLSTIRHMVASGLGITVLPQSAINAETDHGQLLVTLPFSGKSPTRRISLVWRRSFPRIDAIHAVREALLQSKMVGVSWLPTSTIKE